MSGGGKATTYAMVFLTIAAFLLLYPVVMPYGEDGKETNIAAQMHLWRPVFMPIAFLGILILLSGRGMGPIMQSISDVAGAIATGVGKLASFIVLPLIAIIMFDVITRKIEAIKIWNSEITSTHGFSVSFILQDFQWHLHGVLLLMTFGFGYMYNSHVRVDIFRENLSRRGQVWIETIGLTFLAIPFMLVMIGFSWDLFYASFKGWEGSESMVGLGWRWIIKSFLIWGFCIALMAAVATLIRCVNYLFGDIETQTVAEESLQFLAGEDAMAKLILDQNQDAANDGGR